MYILGSLNSGIYFKKFYYFDNISHSIFYALIICMLKKPTIPMIRSLVIYVWLQSLL